LAKSFLRQFNSPLIYILLLAAVIIFFVGQDKLDAFIITGVLLFNAILGTVQEGKARSILESLKRYIKAECVAIRDGKTVFLDESKLVPGDIILLLEGERIPADARVIESTNLKVDEAVLTGESKPVKKFTEPIAVALNEPNALNGSSKLTGGLSVNSGYAHDVSVNKQENMVFRGTYIVAGSGKAIVTATGNSTQIGKISECVQEVQEEMPLRKELNNLSKWIVAFILLTCVAIFVIGFFTGKPLRELFVTLTALFICVVPEGLPIVLTLILVMGARKLAKINVLVKKMQAVEGLGKVDTVLVDKTGTLTRNELVVSKIVIDDIYYDVSGQGYFTQGQILLDKKPVSVQENAKLMLMAKAGCLLNRAEINYIKVTNTFEIKGDPTEAAMYVMSSKIGLEKECLNKHCEVIYEIPFSSKWRYHAVFCKIDGVATVFISGAPEIIMARSKNIAQENKNKLDLMLKDGFRVVAVAVKYFNEQEVKELESFVKNNTGQDYAGQDYIGQDSGDQGKEKFFESFVSSGLEFLGLCGINDSIRSEVVDLVKKTKRAGIDVVMLTGDHKQTAIFVASRVGIFVDGDLVVDGDTLEKMPEKELLDNLDKITVFARVTPDQKLRIVNAYKNKGKIVAMTGDGINDAPSLVAANIGIAMGGIGTEVAKQASDIVLLDDSFSSIVAGIEYGRHILYTLRRVILYFFQQIWARYWLFYSQWHYFCPCQ
jgi:ATPase, P-type (transporting), HAD superfamily, subfamily IC/ATPase, P-type (transporting), HAD superfamily, subfamily IC/ATPase, P-type (transporting), HAD superfamily, subfamily IC